LEMHPGGSAIPSSPSSPSFVARQIDRLSSGYVWMLFGSVSAGGAGGRCEKASGRDAGTRSAAEVTSSDRALSQTVRRSADVGTIVSSV
jgi:hypothetical protein